jgi:inorganic pyrophosphatase
MADFNKVLDPGDYQNGKVNTVVEIPKGSTNKIEWDRQRAAFMVDRVEPKIVVVPADDRHTDNKIKTLDDLGPRWKEQVEHHFAHYKDLYKPGSTKVLGWGDVEAAKKIIANSIARAQNS